MRSIPDDDDDYDKTELQRLNAEPWMVKALSLNPSYPHWGPHEDYMMKRGDGWDSSQIFETWTAFGPWSLDDLNECVNFYFEIARDSEKCAACGESGYNPATREISDTFYDHGDYSIDFVNWTIKGDVTAARRERGATGRRWSDAITEDELQALRDAGRIRGAITLEEVNAYNAYDRTPLRSLSRFDNGVVNHDAINRGILIEARAKRLGVYGLCPTCDGRGYVYTAPAARLGLVLWWLHPRKGCSRGIEIKSITRDQMPVVAKFLADAAASNAARFAKAVEFSAAEGK